MAPGCTLESLMNATEIGDPRMDMGVVTDVQRAQPPFEPTRLLSAMDVLAVMDRLFACEVRDAMVLPPTESVRCASSTATPWHRPSTPAYTRSNRIASPSTSLRPAIIGPSS